MCSRACLLPSPKERELCLGPFVRSSAQNFHVFQHNRLSDRDEISIIGAPTHVERFNDNYDVIGHVVCQPCWKNGKTLGLCTKENIETWHTASTPHGE